MEIVLRSQQDGAKVNALLLSATRSHMRVVLPHCDDTLELRLENNKWNFKDRAASRRCTSCQNRGVCTAVRLKVEQNPAVTTTSDWSPSTSEAVTVRVN